MENILRTRDEFLHIIHIVWKLNGNYRGMESIGFHGSM